MEPGSRFYAMRPLSEQDTVQLSASPVVVYEHQKQFNDTPATFTQAESSRYMILPVNHLTEMQCPCTRYHLPGPHLAVPQQTGRPTFNLISSATGSVLVHKNRMDT
jgi:hypothetical protein